MSGVALPDGPHGPSMRLIVSIDECDGQRIRTTCRFPEAFPWHSLNPMPGYMALEGIAQTAGFFCGEPGGPRPTAGGGRFPRYGYVARIHDAKVFAPLRHPQMVWHVEAAAEGASGQIVLCRGQARQGSETILSVRLALYLEAAGQS